MTVAEGNTKAPPGALPAGRAACGGTWSGNPAGAAPYSAASTVAAAALEAVPKRFST